MFTVEESPNDGLMQQIHCVIQEEPGIHTSELARRFGVSPSTITYHLARLEGQGLVRSVRIGQINHLVADDPERPEELDVLLSPVVRAILDAMDNGGIHSPSELQQSTGFGAKAVRRALGRLEKHGLVHSDGSYHPRYWTNLGDATLN